MKRLAVILVAAFCIVTGFRMSSEWLFQVPENWPAPVYNFSSNPLSSDKIELGRALFYDPILSRDNSISCASCHSQYTAFTHVDHALSHGIEDRIGTRNSPALMNLAWQTTFMWDGAINHLDMQALAPISHPSEMDEKIAKVVLKLRHSNMYPALYFKAFGDSSITGEHTLKSISQFLLTLVSADSKYDKVMRKETEFTAQEKSGYKLFKTNCASCHQEPLFTSNSFENNGLNPDSLLLDLGRMKITNQSMDSLKFKVPTLRNIEFSYPYMHDGRFNKISQVLNHYTSGIHQSQTLSKKLKRKIVLNSNEKVDLTTFLLTLTDHQFLFNPKYSYPKNVFFPSAKD